MGRATVELLVTLGAKVVILDRDTEGGKETEKEMGPNCFFLECDITEEQSVLDCIKKTKERFGNIHGVVNAGFFFFFLIFF